MLPVRAVFEEIGAKVEYISSENKVVASKGKKTVVLVIGSNIMPINGVEKEIDAPATAVNNRTLVICEPFGYYTEHENMANKLPCNYGKRIEVETILDETKWRAFLKNIPNFNL